VERAVLRAIVHPDAARIWEEPPPITSRPSVNPVAPHAISFVACRPPPGKAVVPKSARAVVRAVVHPDATRPPAPRPVGERSGSSPTAPHSITFDAAIKPPR
jgi:hypothetical protein